MATQLQPHIGPQLPFEDGGTVKVKIAPTRVILQVVVEHIREEHRCVAGRFRLDVNDAVFGALRAHDDTARLVLVED